MNWQDDDTDAPQEIDLHPEGEHEDDDGDVVECPFCHEYISEYTERCPACGMWITADTVAAQHGRSWFWSIMVALLLGVILTLWLGFR